MKSHKKLLRVKKIMKAYIKNNVNATATARELGISPMAVIENVDSALGRIVLSKMAQELENVGITDAYIAKKVRKGLNAKQVHRARYDKDGNEVVAREVTPDFNAQHKYLDTTLKIKGHLAEVIAPEQRNLHLHFSKVDINAPVGDKILDFANSLSQDSRRKH